MSSGIPATAFASYRCRPRLLLADPAAVDGWWDGRKCSLVLLRPTVGPSFILRRDLDCWRWKFHVLRTYRWPLRPRDECL